MTYPPQNPWPAPPQPWPPMPTHPAPPAPRRGNKRVTVVIAGLLGFVVVAAGLWFFLGSGGKTKTVKDSDLPRTLLTTREAGSILQIGTLVGNPNSDNGAVQTSWDTEHGVGPCAIGDPATANWHQDTGSTAVRRQSLQSRQGNDIGPDLFFDQAVIAYPDGDAARTVVQGIRDKWQQCVGKDVSQSFAGEDRLHWRVGDVSESEGVVSSELTQLGDDANGWTCRIGMAPRHNVVVEVQVCSATASPDSVGQLVAKLSQKVDLNAESHRSRHRHFRFGRHH